MSQTSDFSMFGQRRFDGKNGKLNLQALLDFSHLRPHVQNHLKNVYSCLSISTAFAALGVYLAISEWFNYPLMAFIGSIISMIWLFTLDFNVENQIKCFALMSATAFFTGVHISPLVNLAVNIDPQLVMSAFLFTSLIFICFTLSALFTSKRTYLFLGGLLGSAMSLMCFLALINFFARSPLIFNVNLYLGLLVACGYVLFDTQLIIEQANHGDLNYVKHAVFLFVDFVDLFVRILIILIKNSQQNNKKKSNNR